MVPPYILFTLFHSGLGFAGEGQGKRGRGEALRALPGIEPGFMEPEVYTTGVSSLKKKKKIKNTKSGRRPWKDPEVSLPLASW